MSVTFIATQAFVQHALFLQMSHNASNEMKTSCDKYIRNAIQNLGTAHSVFDTWHNVHLSLFSNRYR